MVDGTSLPKKSRRVSSYDTNCNKVAGFTDASCFDLRRWRMGDMYIALKQEESRRQCNILRWT
jgi:hypothetical protein